MRTGEPVDASLFIQGWPANRSSASLALIFHQCFDVCFVSIRPKGGIRVARRGSSRGWSAMSSTRFDEPNAIVESGLSGAAWKSAERRRVTQTRSSRQRFQGERKRINDGGSRLRALGGIGEVYDDTIRWWTNFWRLDRKRSRLTSRYRVAGFWFMSRFYYPREIDFRLDECLNKQCNPKEIYHGQDHRPGQCA